MGKPEYSSQFVRSIQNRFPFLNDPYNYSYGDNYVAARYCNFKKTPKMINGEWQHGHIIPERNFHPELVIGGDGLSKFRKEKKYYVARQDQVEYLLKEGYKNVLPIGLPIVYVDKPNEPRIKNSLLIMPSHSLSGIDYQVEEAKFIDMIKHLFPTFELIVCCIHRNDFDKNYWISSMKQKGIETLIGADDHDANTYFRIASLFSQVEYVITDSFGSHVAYASYFGCKVSIIENEYVSPEIQLNNWNNLLDSASFYKNNPELVEIYLKKFEREKIYKICYPFFYKPIREAKTQIEWASFQLGLQHIKTPIELRSIFGWGSPLVNKGKSIYLFFKRNIIIRPVKRFIKEIKRLNLKFLELKLKNELEIFTHLTFHEKVLLYKISKKLPKNAVCVEIGSYLGASSSIIAGRLKKKAKLYCIDTWGNHAMIYNEEDFHNETLIEKETLTEFRKNIFKFKEKIVELQGWSYDMIKVLNKVENRIDFLFIDGDHSYEGVKQDWDLYSKLLLPGSIVAFHDTGWAEGVIKVINNDVHIKADLIHKLPNLKVFRIKET
jgi:predicted O-methyltransferase YrrM